jgi:hypothetical protein
MAYLCANYPYPDELSNSRLTKMVYLADWKMALEHGRQISNIQWVFNHYGPYVHDVESTAYISDDLAVERDVSSFGSSMVRIRAQPHARWPTLNEEEMAVLDHVIDQTKPLTYRDFLTMIYATYPVERSRRYSVMNLVELAEEYGGSA